MVFVSLIKSIKISLILFLLVSIIRILTEEVIFHGGLNLFDAHFHRGPIIRLLEFYMGMLLIPLFFFYKYRFDKYKNKNWFKMIYTFIQIFIPIFIYYMILKYDKILYRCYFVLIFCVIIFIISYDYGYLSDLFAYKLSINIMSCQMEMYLIQNTINNIIFKLKKRTNLEIGINSEIDFLFKLIIIFLGYIYS